MSSLVKVVSLVSVRTTKRPPHMIEATIHEAKTHLSRLIEKALNGEEVVITRNHHPVARLVALSGARPKRRLGGAKGKIVMRDDFDAPLEDFAGYMK